MTYIIENANILQDRMITKTSLLIANGKISSLKPVYKRYRFIRMNAAPYIMTPTPTLLLKEFPLHLSFQETKAYFIEEFILKGCTTFITLANVQQEQALSKEIKRIKTRLLNSPIDYIIGVRIPVRLLTPSFLRSCKREKVPAIFVEIKQVDELYKLPWGWIREAMFPFNSPLVPLFINDDEREKNQMKSEWRKVLVKEKIPSINDELAENEPIPYSALTKIGIYPKKSSLHQGSGLSYNFYLKSREIRNIEEVELFHYHRHMLVITVHKGEVLRANDYLDFRPGYGEHVKINTPSFYTS
ncbi:hypothetical protein ACFYKT_04750 [Cytobacillus sp. FJAT-53684]|uniref:Uncharacterized protein n=1 Tax=Cytobacillus mangrovibacter TaxID=3299024 RepID=A0ABW6JUW6_9BACI